MVATKLATVAELAGTDEDLRVELIEGELVEMCPAGPKHVVYVKRLSALLHEYERTASGVQVAAGEGGYILQHSPDTVLQPDIVVLSDEQWAILEATEEPFAPFAPLIAIEVKSPSEREIKIARKTALYLAAGVQEIWWVRPAERQITVHRPDAAPRTLEFGETLESAALLPGFRMPLAALFA